MSRMILRKEKEIENVNELEVNQYYLRKIGEKEYKLMVYLGIELDYEIPLCVFYDIVTISNVRNKKELNKIITNAFTKKINLYNLITYVSMKNRRIYKTKVNSNIDIEKWYNKNRFLNSKFPKLYNIFEDNK